MTWLQRYRLRRFVQESIWLPPALAIFVAVGVVELLEWIDSNSMSSPLTAEAARSALSMLTGAMFTFIVFVCSSLLLVVQLASAQLTPRAIATIFRDRVTRISLAIFVFTFAFALAALIRINESVPALVTRCAGWACIVSVAVFLYLIDHAGRMLRPSSVLPAVAEEAHPAINAVYPHRLSADAGRTEVLAGNFDRVRKQTVLSKFSGVVIAFDESGIAELARRHDSRVRLVPRIGDFVGKGDPLFAVAGGAIPEQALRQSIALGAERTIEQDPAFAIRLIVDIACKALSPAINDPTTAVLAVDRIHHLLRHLGLCRLDDKNARDSKGVVRLTFRTPNWQDYVTLAASEIRQYGAGSLQVMRRLHAMLHDLIRTLPAERHPELHRELQQLCRTAERSFADPEDQALAAICDPQGVGGAGDVERESEHVEQEAAP